MPQLIDWNGYKSAIAAAVKDATGRDLVIGGDIEIAILPGISFGLSDVSLSNAAGAGEPLQRGGRVHPRDQRRGQGGQRVLDVVPADQRDAQ